jgi:hypothetical protein
LKQFPYKTRIHRSHQGQARLWCEQRYGLRWDAISRRDGRWHCFWAGPKYGEYFDYWFAREQDFLFFALKYSS